jgi:hypothetical protein
MESVTIDHPIRYETISDPAACLYAQACGRDAPAQARYGRFQGVGRDRFAEGIKALFKHVTDDHLSRRLQQGRRRTARMRASNSIRSNGLTI